MKAITENTRVTITVLAMLLGGVFALSRTYFLSDSNAASLTIVQEKQDRYSSDIAEIKADIRVMKTILEKEK